MNKEEYLKQLTQWAVDNPGALWADNNEAAAARDWLRKNSPKDLSSLYWVMNDEQRKKVDKRFIPTDIEQYNFNKGITDATDKIAERITPILLGAVNPAGAMTILGGSAVDFGIESLTKGEKKNFGDLFVDPEKHPYLNIGVNFLNPAYWAGGGFFSKATTFKPLTYGTATLNNSGNAFRKELYSDISKKIAENINNSSTIEEIKPVVISVATTTQPTYVRTGVGPVMREVVPRSRPISAAELQGRPKSMRNNYRLSEQDYKKVLADANEFAAKYGYSSIEDTPDALQQIQDMYRRHNTFVRSIPKNRVEIDSDYGLSPYDWPKEAANLSERERAYIAATKGYPAQMPDRIFVSSTPESVNYYGDQIGDYNFAVRRPISLGHDPLKWRTNAEFNIEEPIYGDTTPNSIFKASEQSNPEFELMLGTGRLSAKPLISDSQITGAFNKPKQNNYIGWLQQQGFQLPRRHLQGDDAVKMFKEYGSQQIPENSQIVEQLRKYVPEVREKYGLVGNTNITDDEIIGSLYKKALELGGNTAAVNEVGEPLLLFRGDTKDYLKLRTHENAGGSEDNLLGTLFLSDPNETSRYLVRANNLDGLVATGASGGNSARPVINGEILHQINPEGLEGTLIAKLPEGSRILETYTHPWRGTYNIWKLPSQNSSTGVNAINGFVVKTPATRDISYEVAVAGGGRPAKVGEEFQWLIPKEERIGKSLSEVQTAQNNAVLKAARANNQGLLFSRPNTPYRGEHEDVFYYALPDFNIGGAKHLLPFDFRIAPQWNSRIIYRKQGGILKAQPGTVIGVPFVNSAKKAFELVAKRSNGAQVKSIPTIVKDVITGRDKSFYNEDTVDGGNEIDTYLYGTPYSTEFVADESAGPDYTNYIKRNYPNQNIKTYNAHFGDTLYIDNKYKDQVVKDLISGKTVGGSTGRYAHAPSYIVTTKEGRPYDAGGHLMKFAKDKDENIVANMSDIYDFLPKDFEEKYTQTENPTWTRYAADAIGTPFIVRQNNIPVRFKEIVPEYKTDLQRQLGNFLSQWGNMYDLTIPLKMTDNEIKEVMYDTQYGDEILNRLQNKGYLK